MPNIYRHAKRINAMINIPRKTSVSFRVLVDAMDCRVGEEFIVEEFIVSFSRFHNSDNGDLAITKV